MMQLASCKEIGEVKQISAQRLEEAHFWAQRQGKHIFKSLKPSQKREKQEFILQDKYIPFVKDKFECDKY